MLGAGGDLRIGTAPIHGFPASEKKKEEYKKWKSDDLDGRGI
jgi:hypothetical protein